MPQVDTMDDEEIEEDQQLFGKQKYRCDMSMKNITIYVTFNYMPRDYGKTTSHAS